MLWTAAFWKGAAERLIKTFAQALLGYITAGEVVGLFDVAWGEALAAAGLAALLSLLTSVGNARFTAGGFPPEDGEHRADV